MSKGLKIGLGVGLIALVVLVLYFLLRGGKKGDKPYVDAISAEAYAAFGQALAAVFPGKDLYNGYIGNNGGTYESLSRGYLKKNNLAMTPANVSAYSSEITAYVNNPASLPHWKL